MLLILSYASLYAVLTMTFAAIHISLLWVCLFLCNNDFLPLFIFPFPLLCFVRYLLPCFVSSFNLLHCTMPPCVSKQNGSFECHSKSCPQPSTCTNPVIRDCCPECFNCMYGGQEWLNLSNFTDPQDMCAECLCEVGTF